MLLTTVSFLLSGHELFWAEIVCFPLHISCKISSVVRCDPWLQFLRSNVILTEDLSYYTYGLLSDSFILCFIEYKLLQLKYFMNWINVYFITLMCFTPQLTSLFGWYKSQEISNICIKKPKDVSRHGFSSMRQLKQ